MNQMTNRTTTPLVRKYHALRTIAMIYKIIAGFAALAALLFTLFAFNSASSMPVAIGAFFIGSIVTLSCFAAAEGILVFLDIEENTRKANN